MQTSNMLFIPFGDTHEMASSNNHTITPSIATQISNTTKLARADKTMTDKIKDQEREELHKAIWSIADDLRGSVDGWDFKQYVLGIMFYRYISENLTHYINQGEHESGNADFDYALLSDAEAEFARAGLIEEKGFFILPSQLFCNVRRRAKNDENLNITLENAFRAIEQSAQGADSEGDFAGLFADVDINSPKLGATLSKRNEKLCKLLDGIGVILDYRKSVLCFFQ